MSSMATPISAQQFAEAIKDLPVANLHFKATEIRNSITHLESSNQQLQPFASDGDSDCEEAIIDNVVVIQRMEERIMLLKKEVERRGFKWGEDEPKNEYTPRDGHGEPRDTPRPTSTTASTRSGTRPNGGRLGGEELARGIMEQMEEDVDRDMGVYL